MSDQAEATRSANQNYAMTWTPAGRRKVAVLIACLDREVAKRLLQSLSFDAIQAIMAELRNVGEITYDMQENVLNEFASLIELNDKGGGGAGGPRRGGDDVAKSLLQEAVGNDKANELMGESENRPFAAVAAVNAEDLATILSKEQPAVAAMVLGRLPPKKMATIVSHFDSKLANQVVTRLTCQTQATDNMIVDRIEKTLASKIQSAMHDSNGDGDDRDSGSALKSVVEMFQHLEPAKEEELLEAIREVSEEKAEEVRQLLFTFEDMVSLPDEYVQLVLRQVPMEKLAVALRGAETEVSEKIMKNLSSNARQNLEEEIEFMGKVKRSVVEEEQRNIVAVVRDLEQKGEIELSTSQEDGDEYV